MDSLREVRRRGRQGRQAAQDKKAVERENFEPAFPGVDDGDRRHEKLRPPRRRHDLLVEPLDDRLRSGAAEQVEDHESRMSPHRIAFRRRMD